MNSIRDHSLFPYSIALRSTETTTHFKKSMKESARIIYGIDSWPTKF